MEIGFFPRPGLPRPGLAHPGVRRGGAVAGRRAEDVVALPLAPGRLRQQERGQRHHRDGDAEQVVGPAPAVDPAHRRSDAAHEDRAEHADQPAGPARHRAHAAPDADRIGVGQQRSVDRQRVGLGDAGPEPAAEQREGVDRHPRREHQRPEDHAGHADDRAPPVAVGQPAHGHRAQHGEGHRRRRDEHDGAVADAERVADVGRQHGQHRALELVERVGDQQHDEDRRAAPAQSLAQRHLVAAHAGQSGGVRHRRARLVAQRRQIGVDPDLAQAGPLRSATLVVGTTTCTSARRRGTETGPVPMSARVIRLMPAPCCRARRCRAPGASRSGVGAVSTVLTPAPRPGWAGRWRPCAARRRRTRSGRWRRRRCACPASARRRACRAGRARPVTRPLRPSCPA